uniref:Dolichyl-diphosphooligosaccharide-protein glycosyltransferase subunit TMEM258 n=1 Tax=Hucho hucho TaxID=62062 RepID=A0A4W5KCC8_9TELE
MCNYLVHYIYVASRHFKHRGGVYLQMWNIVLNQKHTLSLLLFLSQELEAMTRYTSPVNPAVFPHLTVVLLAIGMFFTAWFFVYEVTSTKYTRDVYKELLISLVASLFMGFGVLFLLLWVGIYV